MPITSKELAKLAGVSRGTVDRALHHRGGVRPAVQKQIEALAKEHGYSPNRAGKALVTRGPIRIAVILHSVGNPFFDEVKQGLEKAAGEYPDFNLDISLHEIKGYSPKEQIDCIQTAREQGVDGVIVTPISHPDIAAQLEQLAEANLPVVALNNDIDAPRLCYVGCDYPASGRTAAQMMGYLCGGEGDVAIVTGSLSMLGHRQRCEGFTRQLAEDFPKMHCVEIVENNDDDQYSAQVTTQLMERHSLRGIYFGAAGAAAGCRAAVSMAEDPLSLVVSDPVPAVARLLEQGKVQAAVGQQPAEQGYHAMRTLVDFLLFQTDPQKDRIFTHNEIVIKTNL